MSYYDIVPIKGVSFKLYSPQQILKKAKTALTVPATYNQRGLLVEKGALDPKMGVSSSNQHCQTCLADRTMCDGHSGVIHLQYPVLHIEYIKTIHFFLQMTCSACGTILGASLTTRKTVCQCGTSASTYQLQKPYYFKKDGVDINNEQILEHFSRIDPRAIRGLRVMRNKLDFNPLHTILTELYVLPVISRPSLILPGARHAEDALTHKYIDIIRTNLSIKKHKEKPQLSTLSSPLAHFNELLQYHVSTLFNNSHANLPVATSKVGTPIKSIVEKIKGKQGRFRQNLAGKRIDHSARAVISPTLAIRPDEVAVPIDIAKSLTKRDIIHAYNLEYIKRLFNNYPNFPTVTHVIANNRRLRVLPTNKQLLAEYLVAGNQVERTLDQGDYVLMNRHPSLHRFSIITHRVRLSNAPTLGLNPTVCPPYNADFDGDQMNLHAVQDVPTMVEAKEVMGLENNLLTDKTGNVIIALARELTAGAYILSKFNKTYQRAELAVILANTGITIPNQPLTGCQILKLVLPPISYAKGNLVIQQGLIVKGWLTSQQVGTESKLLTMICQRYGSRYYISMIHTLAKVCVSVLDVDGLSYGLPTDLFRYTERFPGHTQEDFKAYVLQRYPREGIAILAEAKAVGSFSSLVTNFYKIGPQSVSAESKIRDRRDSYELRPVVDYIDGSYANGLDSQSYFLQTMAGRLALIDVFCRTAATGYTSRKLNNCLQSIVVAKDGSLRDNHQHIIQCQYGGDALSIKKLSATDPYVDCDGILETRGHDTKELAAALAHSRLSCETKPRYLQGIITYARTHGVSADQILLKEDALIAHQANYMEDIGTPIGLVTAQALAEPLTQMTLHRRHDVGDTKRATMASAFENIKDLLMATKAIKTPFVRIGFNKQTIHLMEEVKQAVKSVVLTNIAKLAIDWSQLRIVIQCDIPKLDSYGLTFKQIVMRIKRIPGTSVEVGDNELMVTVIKPSLVRFHQLYTRLSKLLLRGKRITEQLYQEGTGDNRSVYVVNGDYSHVTSVLASYKEHFEVASNHIAKVYQTYGLPTAKRYLLHQFEEVIGSQGLTIDRKHFLLLIDAMCYTGVIQGLNRSGVMPLTNSLLARASFETANRVLVSATLTSEVDPLKGPFEATIVGKLAQIGTEMVQVSLDRAVNLDYHR